MKCLVTGARGFIGAHLTGELAAAGHDVVAFSRRVTIDDFHPAHRNRIVPLRGNVLDLNSLKHAAAGRDAVFHLAGIIDGRGTLTGDVSLMDTEVFGTCNVLAAAYAAGVRVMAFASSCAIYGPCSNDQGVFDETQAMAPQSGYAEAKLFCEHYVYRFCRSHSMASVSLRFFNPYGSHQSAAMVIPHFIEAALIGKPLTIFGDGHQSRDFTFICDAVKAARLVVERAEGNRSVNICTGNPSSIRTVAEIVLDLTSSASQLEFIPAPDERDTMEVVTSAGSTALLEALTGISAATPLRDGLAATVAAWTRRSSTGQAR